MVMLVDVVGENDLGEVCHPYANRTGSKKGYFHYKLVGDRAFRPIDEKRLRALIVSGAFDRDGVIRMAPARDKDTKRNAGLNVREYQGIPRGRPRKA